MTRLVGTVVDRVLNVWLLGTYSSQFNQLGAVTTDDATELTLGFRAGELAQGGFLALEDELCYIREVDRTNNRVIVVRGVRGTVPAAHVANTPVEINPRFPRFLVREVLRTEIDAWPHTLHAVASFATNVGAGTGVIDVPAEIDNRAVRYPLRVRAYGADAADTRKRSAGRYNIELGYSDGNTVQLNNTFADAVSYDVLCAVDFLPDLIVDDDVDLIAHVGLTAGMVEIAELGVAYRLLSGRASVRLFSEAEEQSRNAEAVSGEDIPRLQRGFYALYLSAISRETDKLLRLYGMGRG